MPSISFGEYMKYLRKSFSPTITQEQLGKSVERDKMTISLIENGKNDPPQGEFLEKLATALCQTAEEKTKLLDLAAIARGTVPSDILNYFNNSVSLRNAIRRAQEKKYTESDWDNLIK